MSDSFSFNSISITKSNIKKYTNNADNKLKTNYNDSAVRIEEIDYSEPNFTLPVNEVVDDKKYYQELLNLTDNYIDSIEKTMVDLETQLKELEDKYFEFTARNRTGIDPLLMTPEEYLGMLISSIPQGADGEIINKEYEAQCKLIASEYEKSYSERFLKQTGISYEDYKNNIQKLNSDLMVLKASKYALTQETKKLPYLEIAATDDYLKFIKSYEEQIAKKNQLQQEIDKIWIDLPTDRKNNINSEYETEWTIQNLNCLDLEESKYLTEDEQQMYCYLYNKYGSEEASKYKEALEDEINRAKGLEEANKFINSITNSDGSITLAQDSDVLKTAGKGLGDGIQNFGEGILNIFATEGMISQNQYAQMFIIDALKDNLFLTGTYELSTSAGNMVPGIAASLLVSTIATPLAGEVVGYSLMGASAMGNAKNQALIEGNDMLSSTLYGTFNGVSESCLGILLGNIAFLNSGAKFALKDIFKEGFEEFSQEYVDAGLRASILGDTIDIKQLVGNSGKSFLYGAIMSAGTTGMQTLVNVKENGVDKQLTLNDLSNYIASTSSLNNANIVENSATSSVINNEQVTINESIKDGVISSDEVALKIPTVAKYGINVNGNYLINLRNVPAAVVDVAKGVNSFGYIPYEVGLKLENIFSMDNVTLGIHRAGNASNSIASSIIDNGLILSGHTSSGAVSSIDLDNNITFLRNKSNFDFVLFLKALKSSSNYKTFDGTGNAMIVVIPNDLINDISKITYVKNETTYLKPEYILGYTTSTNGSLSTIIESNTIGVEESLFSNISNKFISSLKEEQINVKVNEFTKKQLKFISKINQQIAKNGTVTISVNNTIDLSTKMLDQISDLSKVTIMMYDGLGNGDFGLKPQYNAAKYLQRITYNGNEMYNSIYALEQLQSKIDMNLNPLQRAFQAYKVLADSYEYMHDFENVPNGLLVSQSLRGLSPYNIAGRKGLICAGFASSYYELCSRIGVQCEYITGEAFDKLRNNMSGRHAWNVIKVDGKIIPVDVTWRTNNEDWFGSSEEFARRHFAGNNETYTDYNSSLGKVDIAQIMNPANVKQIMNNINNQINVNNLNYSTEDIMSAIYMAINENNKKYGNGVEALYNYIKSGNTNLFTNDNNARNMMRQFSPSQINEYINNVNNAINLAINTQDAKYGQGEGVKAINKALLEKNFKYITSTNGARSEISKYNVETIKTFVQIGLWRER